MAKKKNAPVLRDGDNNQPAITKSYAVRDKWLDKAKDNLVEFKSVDGEISDLKVNGEPAGGGGGGDFTTAEVTLILDSGSSAGIQGIFIDRNMLWGEEAMVVAGPEDPTPSKVYTFVLYQGKQDAFINTGTAKSTTGNVVYDHGKYEITGDCTITLTGESIG